MLTTVATLIGAARERLAPARALAVAVSGIDGAGKGWVAARLDERLRERGLSSVVIGCDGWLNLPHVRFDTAAPAERFYADALRFDELFSLLVTPLRERRSVRVVSDCAEETATAFTPRLWTFEDVDVILIEGIFLLKRELRHLYDLSVWVDCSFETALERALVRAQEGLSTADTWAAYDTIYFPAQRLHFRRDRPRERADHVVVNDPRLGARCS